jgi:hypothetical protein
MIDDDSNTNMLLLIIDILLAVLFSQGSKLHFAQKNSVTEIFGCKLF